ncbi:Rib/alpha-like domain-containing protein [uncultured Gardnerella sp.]|uniref:Rib/alpha-like domain-containing protein n=1 Tax=uncultured Gardnerella sp. TaxID=293424 RepID=UPI0025DABB89|nr:Rib/alpha-like domain-containing protein [uncultured Gardnerella sp.]
MDSCVGRMSSNLHFKRFRPIAQDFIKKDELIMLPAKFRGFASRVGRLALRAFAWYKTSERDGAARTSSTLHRAILAFFVAVITVLTMLIVPPAKQAMGWADGKAPIHAWWNSFGTGFVSGSGFGIGDAPSQIASNVEVVRNVYDSSTGRNRTQIKWEVFFNTYSQMYESIVTGEPYSGRKEDKAFGGKRPLLMAWLPKGIDRKSIRISRRKSGNRAGYRNYGCWPETDSWYKAFPKDKQFDKTDNGRGCRAIQYQEPIVTINKTLDEFVDSSSRWAHSFDGNLYEGKAGKEGAGKDQQLFNSYWDNALGTSRLTSYCDSNDKHDMCEIRNWKNDFSTVLADWEVSGNTAFQWNITAFVDESMENRSDLVLKNLPFSAGWNSGKGTYSESDFGDLETKKNGAVEVRSKWTFIGPFDSDGDGIPDSMEGYDHKNPDALPDFSNSDQQHTVLNNITDPNGKTEIKYPQYSSSMMNDYVKKLNNQNLSSDTTYGGVENVPVTTYGTPVTIKPYVNTGSWQGWDLGEWDGQYSLQNHYGGHYVAGKDTDTTTNIPSDFPNGSSMKYELTSIPQGVKQSSSCSTGKNNSDKGCVSIDSKTGYITYNPGKLDRKTEGITFKVKITHPTPSTYQYNCKYKTPMVQENVPIKIKVVSNAMLYNPQYKETTVDYNKSTNKFNSATSEEPKSVRANKKPWVRVGSLPNGSTFKLEQYTKYSLPVLDWSKIDQNNSGNGKVTFTPSNAEAGANTKTPVVVTYPDGSTSKDNDSGNSGNPVYAPVTVGDLPISGSDLNLGLYNGKKIDNNAFGGFSFGHKSNPHEIDKGKKIGAKDKDNPNPNNGIVFDSWANHGKGPITFRVICHRTDVDNSPFALLKPKEGNNEASGEINGLHFEDFRQWIRDNDKRCKGKDCSDSNKYLHSSEYNRDTMERSRALIGGTPKEGGSYECKVFAFHQKPGDKDSKDYSASLTAFENASSGGSIALQSLFTNYETAKKDAKGSEWVAGSFYFKIKLKDNQKYNPTYVKIPEIQAGKSIKDGRYSSPTKDNISTDQPKSTKTGNGVVRPADQASILVGDLPDGTWFEIKRFVKAGDVSNSKAISLPWANFEDGEDNVTRDEKGKPVIDKKSGKVVTLDQSSREYGSVTFHPDKWQSAGQYWAEVRVHYPDGSVSDGEGSVNKDYPVYAKVNVTAKPGNNTFGLNLFRYTTDSQYRTISVENGINLHPGDLLSGNDRPMFDSYLTNAIGNLHQHMICSKQSKDGKKQTEYTYGMLPGHVNNEKSQNENEKDGLRLLEPQTIWKHSSLKDQLECNANNKNCKSDTYLYDDWVDGDKSFNTFERTHGSFGGVAQKTGDYVCKVYVIKGDAESNKFESAVKANIEKNNKAKKDVDPVDGVLNANDNPYGTEGVGYKTGAFSVHIHKDNQLYNPTYTKIPEIQAGSTFDKNLKKGNKAAISSDAPQSKKKVTEGNTEVNANGVPKEDLVNVKEGALPAGTWYEIKRFVKASDITNSKASSLPWANFEDGEDNKADGKQEAKDSNATGKGSVTFRPDKWQSADEYWAEIRVHYPDGSVSDGDDSINKDHPIYAKVKVTRPAVGSGDLHLNVYKQYENGKFTGDVDNVNGITVMKGVGLLKDMGIDSWSTAKPEGITLRALCRDDSDEARKSTTHTWSEDLDNLFFKLNWQQAWKYPTFARQEDCRKGSNNGDGCNATDEHFLFDSTGGTMERARGTITSSKAPTKSGKYYCVVLAMKLTDLGKYKKAIKNSKISVTDNNFAKAMGFTDTEGIDYAAKFFPVHVVEQFKLPKTGGEGISMAWIVLAMIGMCVMCGAFFVDQTKWGHAMLAGWLACMMCGLRSATQNSNSKISKIWRGLVKKVKIKRFDDYCAHLKDFVCKATKWCFNVMLRIGRWITERWRC